MLKSVINLEMGSIDPDVFRRVESSRQFRNMRFMLEDKSASSAILTYMTHTIELSPDSNSLLVGACCGRFWIYEAYKEINANWTGDGDFRLKVLGGGSVSSSIAVSPRLRWFPKDSRLFASSGKDSNLQIWDVERLGAPVDKSPVPDRKSKEMGYYVHDVNPINPKLIAGATETEKRSFVEVLDLRVGLNVPVYKVCRGELRMKNRSPVRDLIWNPLVISNLSTTAMVYPEAHQYHSYEIKEWDLRNGKPVITYREYDLDAELKRRSRVPMPYSNIKYSSDGLQLYAMSPDNFDKYRTSDGLLESAIEFTEEFHGARRQFGITKGLTPDIGFVPVKTQLKIVDLKKFEILRSLVVAPPHYPVGVTVDTLRQIVYTSSLGVRIYGAHPFDENKRPADEEYYKNFPSTSATRPCPRLINFDD